jgi:hypothetical protein
MNPQMSQLRSDTWTSEGSKEGNGKSSDSSAKKVLVMSSDVICAFIVYDKRFDYGE